jgi:hypothetical protein
LVQTLVNAAGKKSSKLLRLPKFSLSLTSTNPVAFFDLRVKSGACEPTLIAINLVVLKFWDFPQLYRPTYNERRRACASVFFQPIDDMSPMNNIEIRLRLFRNLPEVLDLQPVSHKLAAKQLDSP